MAVNERHHTSVMHMPIAISVCNLRDLIIECLQKKHSNLPPLPRYTGLFQVKYAV